jgi:hypothetical protein
MLGPRTRSTRAAIRAAALPLLFLPSLPAVAPEGPSEAAHAAPSPAATAPEEEPRTIRMQVGVEGLVYLGQPLKDLLERFPKAATTPFAHQQDAVTVTLLPERISCIAVGPDHDSLRVASVGFDFSGITPKGPPRGFRTAEGIGRGSTVEDLMRAYGTPEEITDERGTKPLLRRQPQQSDPAAPKKYLYNSPDGAVSTYFLVQEGAVLRVVINDKAPLDRYILRHRPGD